MVANSAKFIALIFACSLAAAGCEKDLFGMVASRDFSSRWQARHTFNFLTAEDKSIALEDGQAYSFIMVADTHIQNGSAWGLERLKGAIDCEVRFVVVLGDITQSGRERDLRAFIEIAGAIRDMGVPVFPVIGNHDVYFGNWEVWKRLIGSTIYRASIGLDALLFLDSANAFFGARQLDWLEGQLRGAAGRAFVFTHFNLFAENFPGTSLTDTRERARLVSMLRGRADAMFMGHAHSRSVRELGGVVFITLEDFRGSAVYCRVWVSESGIRWEFRSL